jgi:hypothetical protein
MATRRRRDAPYDRLPLAEPVGTGLTAGETCLLFLFVLTLPIGVAAVASL